MSMIERVARAVYEKRNGPGCPPWAHQPKGHKAPYLSDARAAIEAMAEPSDDFMEEVHIRSYDGRFSRTHETYPVYRNFMRSLVDAALSPTPEAEK